MRGAARGWLALACALAVAACGDTEGEVLTTVGGDAGGDVGDAGVDAPDAAVDPCAAELPCPDPMPGAVTVCGRVLDLETSGYVAGGGVLDVELFNPVDFPASPSLADTQADECGRFRVENVYGALPPFIIASTDDDRLLGGEYVRVVSLVPNNPGNSVRANVYAMRSATDDAWSAAAGLGAATFSDLGAIVMIYLGPPPLAPFQGTPVTGVAATEDGGTFPSRDYYFSDGEPRSRTAVAPGQAQTGANGTAIITSPLITNEYSGNHASCTFGRTPGGAPGIVQVQELLGSCN